MPVEHQDSVSKQHGGPDPNRPQDRPQVPVNLGGILPIVVVIADGPEIPVFRVELALRRERGAAVSTDNVLRIRFPAVLAIAVENQRVAVVEVVLKNVAVEVGIVKEIVASRFTVPLMDIAENHESVFLNAETLNAASVLKGAVERLERFPLPGSCKHPSPPNRPAYG
jgi:hypothetical protein